MCYWPHTKSYVACCHTIDLFFGTTKYFCIRCHQNLKMETTLWEYWNTMGDFSHCFHHFSQFSHHFCLQVFFDSISRAFSFVDRSHELFGGGKIHEKNVKCTGCGKVYLCPPPTPGEGFLCAQKEIIAVNFLRRGKSHFLTFLDVIERGGGLPINILCSYKYMC